MSNIKKPKLTAKPLGVYLVEAGIISPDQVEIAINEQNYSSRRLGEILVERGWVKRETIEYFMEKVVLPEQRTVETKMFRPRKSSSYTLNLVSKLVRRKGKILVCDRYQLYQTVNLKSTFILRRPSDSY